MNAMKVRFSRISYRIKTHILTNIMDFDKNPVDLSPLPQGKTLVPSVLPSQVVHELSDHFTPTPSPPCSLQPFYARPTARLSSSRTCSKKYSAFQRPL